MDYVCSGCKRTILAVNVRPNQVQDVVAECPDCKAESRFPPMPPGEPIALGQTAVVWPFRAPIRETVLFQEGWLVLISRNVAERFTSEVGLRFRWRVVRDLNQINQVDPESGLSIGASPPRLAGISIEKASLESALVRFERVLGQRYDPLFKSPAPWRREPRDRMRSHSIQRTRNALATAVETLSRGGGPVDGSGIADANLELTLLERWSHHPFFDDVLTHLEVAPDYTHAIATVGIASVLSEMGNGVALGKPIGESTSVADLAIAAGPTERLRVEVKAPEGLDNPRRALSPRECVKLVKHAFRKAGVGPGGQLAPELPGFLGLGCFGLSLSDLSSLEVGARMYLEHDRGPYRHVPGVLIANFAFHVHGVRIDGQPGLLRPGDTLATPIEVRIAMNRTYDGRVPISTSPGPESPQKDFGPDCPRAPPTAYTDWPAIPSRLAEPAS